MVSFNFLHQALGVLALNSGKLETYDDNSHDIDVIQYFDRLRTSTSKPEHRKKCPTKSRKNSKHEFDECIEEGPTTTEPRTTAPDTPNTSEHSSESVSDKAGGSDENDNSIDDTDGIPDDGTTGESDTDESSDVIIGGSSDSGDDDKKKSADSGEDHINEPPEVTMILVEANTRTTTMMVTLILRVEITTT